MAYKLYVCADCWEKVDWRHVPEHLSRHGIEPTKENLKKYIREVKANGNV